MLFSKKLKGLIQNTLRRLGYQIVRFRPDAEKDFGWLRNHRIASVLDVGANEGQFASEIIRIFPDAQVYCFEPLREAYERLVSRFGKSQNFTFFNVAVGDITGEMPIHKNEFSPASSLLGMQPMHVTAFPYTKHETVDSARVERLDNLLKSLQIEPPVLLKVDVQGYEARVLRGANKTVANASVILVECNFQEMYEGQSKFEEIYEYLIQRDFVFKGCFDTLKDPRDGLVLQGDLIFVKTDLFSTHE